MDQLTLGPYHRVNGHITVPGSKSLSNRALLLAALAKGTTRISNLLDSDDTRHMLTALRQLGVRLEHDAASNSCVVTGLGGGFKRNEPVTLDLGNAGTAMRPLAAVLALSEVDATLIGEPRMYERPIDALIHSLQEAGAGITCLNTPGYPPLRIKGKRLPGAHLKVAGNISSQFLTALLMAAPLFDGQVCIDITGELVSKPYIDITLNIMARFGVEVVHHDYQRFTLAANQSYISPDEYMVEGDASSASYFLAAAAIKGGSVTVHGVGRQAVQGDTAFAEVLASMGAGVEWQDSAIRVTRGALKGIDADLNHIPDAAMTIATTALFAAGPTVIRNIYNWRVKETDRLAAMATELRKTGATVEEGRDYIAIHPPTRLRHAVIDTYNDHRMAMCFSLLSLSDVAVTINDPGCVSKTFPDYFSRFATLVK